MQFPLRPQVSGSHRLALAFALAVVVQIQAAKSSFEDSVGTELLSRVDVQRDALGDLDDELPDGPEQLDLTGPPREHAPTKPVEVALVQSKASHKPKEAPHRRKVARTVLLQKARQHSKKKVKVSRKKAKDPDAEVDQLGGSLANIMSDLDGPNLLQEQTNGKQALEKASAMEDEVNSNDDLAMEKEAASEPVKTEDAENVVDGAMAYIRTRLATEEHKSLRLKQLLAQSVRGNTNMRKKVEQLRKQLTDGANLQKNLQSVTAKKLAQEEAQFANETKRADKATVQLKNATRAAHIGEKALKFLGIRLKYAKTQVADLLHNLANSTQQHKDLYYQVKDMTSAERAKAKALANSKEVVASQQKELAATKAKLLELQAAKKADDTKLTSLDRQKDFLEQRQVSAGKRDNILHKENSLLKKQLSTEIQREEQLRQMWSKESEAFTWQLRSERANASESLADLEKARAEFRDLRNRVSKLRERASQGDQSRHAAEGAAKTAEAALKEAETENKQLKGSIPWLEAEVDRQRQAAQNTTREAQQALRERDTVKAILGEAQKNIVQLQGQYADTLQALVVAQAGGQDASKQADTAVTNIEQFANPLGMPPPVASPVGFPGDPEGASSLLELGRDSRALTGIMGSSQQGALRGRVDLRNLLRGMNHAR
jgi:hypothetical protein